MSRRLFAEDYTVSEYKAILRVIRDLHVAWEGPLFDAQGNPFLADGESLHSIAPRLDHDLAFLGCFETPRLIDAPTLPECDTARLGVHYVLVGASFGAASIHRYLKRSLGDNIAPQLQYHRAQPDNIAWATLKRLMTRPYAIAGATKTVAAARQVFETFYAEFAALEVRPTASID
ncbi:MAG: hypothetical protein AAFY56_19790 [Pseudomonadota bacterium]